MSFADKVKKILGKKEQDPGQVYLDAVDAEYKRMQKQIQQQSNLQNHITKCVVTMKDCIIRFNMAIDTERTIARKKLDTGIPIEREKTRIREAAIGIMTAKMALLDLESISSEADLHNAMNRMGKALRQLIILDNTGENISGSTRSFIDMFYPSFRKMVEENENYTIVRKTRESGKSGDPKDLESLYEIPEEVRSRIDDAFVEDLLAGDSYEMAMFKALRAREKKNNDMDISNVGNIGGGLTAAELERINKLAEEYDDGDIARDHYFTKTGIE